MSNKSGYLTKRDISEHLQGAEIKVSLKFFCSFLSNRLEFHSEILPTYLVVLCTRNLSAYRSFKVIIITVMPPIDFGVLRNSKRLLRKLQKKS